jgi:hypothetical protein
MHYIPRHPVRRLTPHPNPVHAFTTLLP